MMRVGLLKQEDGSGSSGVPRPAPVVDQADERARVLACAVCRQRITTKAERIEVEGRHEHTLANPFGYVYHVGCFASASGLTHVGPPSTEFAWFAGYSWQIEQCGVCREHLGWTFRSAGDAFHGLVLDRLVELEDEG
jgi:hypothetical protein